MIDAVGGTGCPARPGMNDLIAVIALYIAGHLVGNGFVRDCWDPTVCLRSCQRTGCLVVAGDQPGSRGEPILSPAITGCHRLSPLSPAVTGCHRLSPLSPAITGCRRRGRLLLGSERGNEEGGRQRGGGASGRRELVGCVWWASAPAPAGGLSPLSVTGCGHNSQPVATAQWKGGVG